jgi:hypothetical protein
LKLESDLTSLSTTLEILKTLQKFQIRLKERVFESNESLMKFNEFNESLVS